MSRKSDAIKTALKTGNVNLYDGSMAHIPNNKSRTTGEMVGARLDADLLIPFHERRSEMGVSVSGALNLMIRFALKNMKLN